MKPSHAPSILVVEDSDDDFIAMSRALDKAGVHTPVQRCTNGDQALDYMYRRGEFAHLTAADTPSLVLLDLNLPGTDGREVLRQLKRDLVLRKTPVIVLTTSGAAEDVRRCYDDGANSYVKKPVDMPSLIHAMDKLKAFWIETATSPTEANR